MTKRQNYKKTKIRKDHMTKRQKGKKIKDKKTNRQTDKKTKDKDQKESLTL